MKAIITIIAVALTLQAGILFASNDITSAPTVNELNIISLISLSPATPVEATFNDMPSEMISVDDLAPVTPAIADFNDSLEVMNIDIEMLRPAVPAEADFE